MALSCSDTDRNDQWPRAADPARTPARPAAPARPGNCPRRWSPRGSARTWSAPGTPSSPMTTARCSSRQSTPSRCWSPRTRSGRPSGTRPAGSGKGRHCASRPLSMTTWPGAPLTRHTPSGGICAASAGPSKNRISRAAGLDSLRAWHRQIDRIGSRRPGPATAVVRHRDVRQTVRAEASRAVRDRHPTRPRSAKITGCHRLGRYPHTAAAPGAPVPDDCAPPAPSARTRVLRGGRKMV
jgi:hypothetical protein